MKSDGTASPLRAGAREGEQGGLAMSRHSAWNKHKAVRTASGEPRLALAPVSPGPGPAPGGAAGGGSGGSGGIALSGLLPLAGLLLLAGPRAIRRLRLSCLPLLTACFVLIPERPGELLPVSLTRGWIS